MTSHTAATIAGLTDVGQVRRVNEDAILIDNDLQLYAIADGMGGHGSGDVASKLAVETLQNRLASNDVAKALANQHISNEQAMSLVSQCIVGVNSHIYKRNVSNGHPVGTGMGTTLVGMCFLGSDDPSQERRVVTFNVGDSRLYEFHQKKLQQLTQDHTMYQDWEETGRIGPAPPRNIIMRAIGLFGEVEIDLNVITVRNDATYLLCSDGLTCMLSDDLIVRVLDQPGNTEKHSYELVQRANDNGGVDNISVVILAP